MHTVGRWALRVPDGTDGPANVPLWMDRLAVDLTDVAKDNQGTLGARPVSTVPSPGVSGRYFTTTDELDGGAARRRLYRDAGTVWDELASLPVTRRMLDAAVLAELPATGLLTAAQFLALPAQADGTVVRVVIDTTDNIVARFRLNKASGNAAKWECEGCSPGGVYREVDTSQALSSATGAWGDLPTAGPEFTLLLGGDWDWHIGTTFIMGSNNATMLAGLAIGAAAAPTGHLLSLNQSVSGVASVETATFATSDKFTALAAGAVLRMRYQWSTINTGNLFHSRWLRLLPQRVVGPAAL